MRTSLIARFYLPFFVWLGGIGVLGATLIVLVCRILHPSSSELLIVGSIVLGFFTLGAFSLLVWGSTEAWGDAVKKEQEFYRENGLCVHCASPVEDSPARCGQCGCKVAPNKPPVLGPKGSSYYEEDWDEEEEWEDD